ncbi:FAD-dependent oxidoreductase, partial [Klebsiella pneumoniae]|nr:FAD-dependent oxidoreductase [Klebsiella pneumoniae]
MTKAYSTRGVEIRTNVAVQNIENKKTHVHITLASGETLDADYALVAVGRKVYTEGLMLEKAGLMPGEKGALAINDKM